MKVKSNVQAQTRVPYFRPSIGAGEIEDVVSCLRSGWLTTGARAKEFEREFADFVGGQFAVALNSCTAALHLAVEALGLRANQAVLVPTMTFAATAEVVRYLGAVPVLVDCDPVTLNMDLEDAEFKLQEARSGRTVPGQRLEVVGIIPVHVGGVMMDMDVLNAFAVRHGLWVVEDAAHALPAAFRGHSDRPWRRCGDNTAAVTCFSFYANKTITTGEGGMAVTDNATLAERIRQMSLHGLSQDAWGRYANGHGWDYRILAPGYKYNMTDIAAAIGLRQLERAEAMRLEREALAHGYRDAFADLGEIELPHDSADRIQAWHLFPIRLRLEELPAFLDRNGFIEKLREQGVGCSVHWRPLHLHPYYEQNFNWRPDQFPVATEQWSRLISLPIFPGMRKHEQDFVISVVRRLCGHSEPTSRPGRRPRKPR